MSGRTAEKSSQRWCVPHRTVVGLHEGSFAKAAAFTAPTVGGPRRRPLYSLSASSSPKKHSCSSTTTLTPCGLKTFAHSEPSCHPKKVAAVLYHNMHASIFPSDTLSDCCCWEWGQRSRSVVVAIVLLEGAWQYVVAS